MKRARVTVLWVTLAIVFVLVVTGGAAVVRFGGWNAAVGTPAAVPPFPVPGLRATPGAVLPPDDASGPAPAAAALARLLAPLLADRRLGTSVSASVVDAETGDVLLDRRAGVGVAPASTTKIITAAAVLAAVGPDRRLVTRAVAGTTPGAVVLVGGGDPTLAAGPAGTYPGAARLDRLAAQVRKAAGGPLRRVLVDGGLFTGPTTGPGWDSDIVTGGFGAPVTALTTDGGRRGPRTDARSPAPDLAAGRAFARALGLPRSAVARGAAPAGARELGAVSSPPMLTMVEYLLTHSDNVLADTLARQVAIERRLPASFAGASEAIRATLAGLGLDAAADGQVDGSGLSRANRLTPALLTSVLAVAGSPDHPELRGVLTGLPVARYSGTLADRFVGAPAGAGLVRAKTGTLSGVSALSGVLLDASGRRLAFAVVADGVPAAAQDSAEAALDRIGAALTRCGCR
ncbi:MAG TPA: D-alanyl-D-alanine carboxypeptidase/D-alanyl-D-alanine-endopeptidase [Mycobacteriales bacterium]|nr:D-alanyl-D-alanine carboxypeptidase/D-alanyl-D-alanine-endopeptidase [Mycobacteriales bacterium]